VIEVVGWLAFATNTGLRSVVSRCATVEESSSAAVMLTFGMCSAISSSTFTSSIVAITIAVATITTPSAR